MASALEGETEARPSLKQEANAQRIGRSRFIGHAIGVSLVVIAAGMALSFAGFRQTVQMGAQAATLPNVWVALGRLAVLMLALLDLGIRRRQDRNRSGVDCAVVLMVLAGLAVAGLFGRFTRLEAMAAEAAAVVLFLYLVLMLALLPGNRGPNRYGEPPRRDD